MKYFLVLIFALSVNLAYAQRQLTIVHVNDTHSHAET